jgi:serine/threonine-protein kinase PknK
VFQVGDRIGGRYRILEPLGAGGMADVFLVADEPRRARCVLKELRAAQPELLAAFRDEFALLCRVTHPNLTRVLDFGTELMASGPVHYYTAEWVDGTTLAERAGELGSKVLEPWLDALDGLRALHAAGIRHGDFTPHNVLVRDDGSGVLIDLGCARPFGPSDVICGTRGFVAPELLRGAAADGRADLYSAGACLRALWREKASARVARTLERLLADDPSERPSDAQEVLESFGRQARRNAAPRPPRLLAREREIGLFEAWLRRLEQAESSPRVLLVRGASGAGTSRLVRELCWRAELRVRVLRAAASETAPVSRLLAQLCDGVPASGSRAVLAAARALHALSQPLLLVVEDHERLDPEQRELLATLARLLEDDGRAALLVSGTTSLELPRATELELGPLPLSALREWAAGRLSERALRELHAASGGLPRAIERALTGGATAVPANLAPAALEPAGRQALALVQVLGGELLPSSWNLPPASLTPLFELGLLQRDGAGLALGPVRCELSREELRLAHAQVAQAIRSRNPGGLAEQAELVRHLLLAGEEQGAETLFRDHAASWRSEPKSVTRALEPLVGSCRNAETVLEAAELLVLAGAARAALRGAARCTRLSRAGDVSTRARAVAVDALLRLGRARRAERLAERDPLLLGRLARARLQRGDYAGAEQAARQGIELELENGAQAQAALEETLGISLGYLGRTSEAEQHLQAALAGYGEHAAPRERCRVLGHRAILAFRAGRLDAAIAEHARALAIAEEHDLGELLPVCLLNLGTAEQQAGQLGGALASYERGLLLARASGRESTELTLLYNLANTYAEIGAFERAREALQRLERRASAARLEHFAPAIALLRAELELDAGTPEEASAELDRAEAALGERGLQRELVEVGLRRLDVELARGDLAAAEGRLTTLAAAADACQASDLSLGAELGAARLALARSQPARAREVLERAVGRARAENLRLLEARLQTELARACELAGDGAAQRQHGAQARRLWDRIGVDLPQALLDVFWSHPRRSRLGELTRLFAAPRAGPGPEPEALGRLLALNRRLNSSLSATRVVDYALQAAIELTGAERGFLLGKDAELVASAGEQASGDAPSRSIALRAIQREEPVLSTDAELDARFAEQRSVHALRLKSVLCVPILAPGGTLGALYVDNRVMRGRFSDREKELLQAFADQVAIALSNARLHAELERRTLELEEQKRAVERLSRGQAREIERLQKEVTVTRQSLGLRYDYAQIAGRSAAMQSVLERLDRVTDSAVSVLIEGESGTGKELAARALHFNGPRRERAFMGINCAALPETLLESELFGHVRGAFTGADRDKQGLMQAADGGTLFLDELGELPLGTQAKLLRVLQERELRPVGGTKTIPLDLRLICATHRDLAAEVERGRFREDLYYRVAVVSVRMPPLRERVEDLPDLCRVILGRVARSTKRPEAELDPGALRLLASQRWPGNVRELENALTRASVLCSGGRIRPADLDLAPARARRSGSRSEFERDERERIQSALVGARWNVSVVSRTLGIPRNTLYRKLARYGLLRETPS